MRASRSAASSSIEGTRGQAMMKLYGYFRSSAAFRVRIALNLKELDYETAAIHLRRNDQSKPDYRGVNPQGLVPALEDGGRTLIQSLAIIEYLDETLPDPPLLPKDPAGPGAGPRARRHRRLRHPPDQQSARAALPDAPARPRRDGDRELVQSLDRRRASGDRAAAREDARHRPLLPRRLARSCRHRAGSAGRQCRAIPARSRALSDLERIYENCMRLEAFTAAHPGNQPDYEA